MINKKNYTKVFSPQSGWKSLRKQTTTNAGKDAGEKEPTSSVGGIITMKISIECTQKTKNKTTL
jgi:hypothetical protein